ncbi:hypothetical protein RHMOL_Rhmol10G0170000 [Rhododendron molle]|uniref:Uncharacterized protein n=1 Tax=Rhododendron molle TaxID=49168 RepID=A0ACC0M4A5_RHOML|nr:hypothetical protein RHMOL_Rhmol10G0170000 [Rhododendron molle]
MDSLCSCSTTNMRPPVLKKKSMSGTRNLPLLSWLGIRTSIWNKWTTKATWTRHM